MTQFFFYGLIECVRAPRGWELGGTRRLSGLINRCDWTEIKISRDAGDTVAVSCAYEGFRSIVQYRSSAVAFFLFGENLVRCTVWHLLIGG